MEYASVNNRSAVEYTSAAQSLRRYKRTPAYLLQLRRAILDGNVAELRASTELEKKRMRLKSDIARMELEELEAGAEPTALSGHIALQIN